jgi:hypothetical protein
VGDGFYSFLRSQSVNDLGEGVHVTRSMLGVPLPLWSWERFCYSGKSRATMGGKHRAIISGEHRAAMPGKHRATMTGKVYPGQ